jgi:hypothetical protein
MPLGKRREGAGARLMRRRSGNAEGPYWSPIPSLSAQFDESAPFALRQHVENRVSASIVNALWGGFR